MESFLLKPVRVALNDFDQDHLGRFEILGLNMNVFATSGPVNLSLEEISIARGKATPACSNEPRVRAKRAVAIDL